VSFGGVKPKDDRDGDLHGGFTRQSAATAALYADSVNHASRAPRTVAELLNLLVADPGRPRLTWYGPQGERVELSGAVLQNWVSKTTNLVVEEFDAGPGSRILVDLPVHWRTVVWALGAWRCGSTLVLAPSDEARTAAQPVDVVVTSRPDVWSGVEGDLVAVALPALARSFDGDLPPGAIDAASAVMTYGDIVAWAPETDPDEIAIAAGHESVRFSALVPEPAASRPSRVIVEGDRALGLVLHDLLAAWAADGSAVLTSAETALELRDDPARLARLRETERVT